METNNIDGKIYRLLCDDGHYYIGSTIQPLNLRLTKHVSMSKQGVNKIYEYINQIGWDHVTIELIEDYPCTTKKELTDREKYHTAQSKNDPLCLNHMTINIYKTGKIYRIICNDGHYYIGSTTQTLPRRLHHHKQLSKKDKTAFYNHMKQLGWENASIELLEDYPCDTKKELSKREDEYITKEKENPLCLNINRAQLSPTERKEQVKEYYEANKSDILVKLTQYRKEHHEEILKKKEVYRKNHREELCEKQKKYAKEHPDQVKSARMKYYEEHKEEQSEYYKEYRKQNSEEIKARQRAWEKKKREENADQIAEERLARQLEKKEKSEARIKLERAIHTCECGGTYQFYQRNRHLTNKKHTAFLTEGATLNQRSENIIPS